MKAADFGTGSGHFAFALAGVLQEGRVYAVDVQKALIERLKSEASHRHLNNIEIIWGDVEQIGGTKLKEASLDLVVIANILFQVEDKKTPLLEAKRVLKPSGRLLIIDWQESYQGMGPEKKSVFTKDQARALLGEIGFEFVREVEAGSHHYGLLSKRI